MISWNQDNNKLPYFEYKGAFPAELPNGKGIIPTDPFSILGNYRMTLFPHYSGKYQFITGDRVWARLNQGDSKNTGENGAAIQINGAKHNLIIDESSDRFQSYNVVFGVGFARYEYRINDLKIVRTISVKPSLNSFDGYSVFNVTVVVSNESDQVCDIRFSEWIRANFEMIFQQRESSAIDVITYEKQMTYIPIISANSQLGIIQSDFHANSEDVNVVFGAESISQYEGYPPSLFMKVCDTCITNVQNELTHFTDSAGKANLNADFEFILHPGEKQKLNLFVGYTWEKDFDSMRSICRKVLGQTINPYITENSPCGIFSQQWADLLPDFAEEPSSDLRNEMIWHTHILEAMATYSNYYMETKIPQGTIYDYYWGIHASTRDHFQHILPLMYYNNDLAKSCMRYLLKRVEMNGEIKVNEQGYGWATNEMYKQSDLQLYFFWTISEYLKICKDYDFLVERINYYPMDNETKSTTIDKLERAFIFLRDEIRTGSHGLVRLLNSDYDDEIYFWWKEIPFNRAYEKSESLLNTSMAIAVLGDLAHELEIMSALPRFKWYKEQISFLSDAMNGYRDKLLTALNKELGKAEFLPRVYFDESNALGVEEMHLLSQIWPMMIPEVSKEKKLQLCLQIENRLMNGEKVGARHLEKSDNQKVYPPGERTNAGIWIAPNMWLVLALKNLDLEKSKKLFHQFTFHNLSKSFPDYWTNYWSCSDVLNSSLSVNEGLQILEVPVFCAHIHAYMVYCWFKLFGKTINS